MVGVYASPNPEVSVIFSENVLVFRSQRYSFPSSLLARILLVAGSTAAVLMHHSRTPPGWSASGVRPRIVRTSCITVAPVTGSIMVALGSRMAILFWPLPVPIPA